MQPTHVNASRKIFSLRAVENFREVDAMTTMSDLFKTATIDVMRVVLGHGASGNAASMKPYVVGFKRRGIDAIAVDLPRGNAERAIPVFIKTSGRGHEVVGGGQSFGGRVASMAAVEADFGGLVLFSYPLHRPGFPDQLRTDHWPQIRCPTLFLSGDRDPFANLELLKKKIKLIPDARLEVFKGQGHGLLAVLDQALDVAAAFIRESIERGVAPSDRAVLRPGHLPRQAGKG
jgi:predicted alpha/beta-hydrolase family hydrolase